MGELRYEILARMASPAYQAAYLDRATPEAYVLPEELLDTLLGELRRCILHTNDPLKESLLNRYVSCAQESDKLAESRGYPSEHWENIRTAVKNFLAHRTDFNLVAWEAKEIV